MEALFWFMLEAGLALAALVLIVWWTWPKGDRADAHDKAPKDRK